MAHYPGLEAMFGRPVAVALLAFAALEVAAAVGLLGRRRWARFALYGVGAAQLVIFPIGTALTIYTGARQGSCRLRHAAFC